jgi:hypothetical protein
LGRPRLSASMLPPFLQGAYVRARSCIFRRMVFAVSSASCTRIPGGREHDSIGGRRQKYSSEPKCRAASKQSSQRRWLRKPENQEYFRGEQHVERVQAWRARNPGYWRKTVLNGEPLQEMIRAQPHDLHEKSGSLPLQETRGMQGADPNGQSGSLRGTALQDLM